MNITLRRPMLFLMVLVDLMAVSARGVTQSASGAADEPLPVSAVTLFTSGVGHFRHQGTVDGPAEVTLAFDAGDIDDLLKSLVLQDLDGGVVEAVTYPSRDPLNRILGSFSLNIADNPSLAELLSRARGEAVRVGAPAAAEGTVLGIEYSAYGPDAVSVPVLNLATASGIRQVSLSDLSTLEFLNPRVQADLESALAVIAANRQEDRKYITLKFAGDGRRRVSVSYVREVPVWKTSYRLVLGEGNTARLQGWAMVENTGETDWNGVSLGLATGQPISFVMDLYTPLYVARPRVNPETGPAVAPQEYERDRALSKASAAPAPSARASDYASESAALSAFEDWGDTGSGPASINLSQGVQTAAAAEGESLYRLSRPVSVPRREAALLPIIGEDLPAERLSVYDRDVLASNPLKAVRISNTSGVRLPAGPATIFDGALYAGDARVPASSPGESRLLSYAVDSGTGVIVRSSAEPEEIVALKIVGGSLETTNKLVSVTEYAADRTGDGDVLLLLVHPKREGWTVESRPGPVSETSTDLHFELKVPGGGSAVMKVEEHFIQSQRFALNTLRDDRIVFYLSRRSIDAETRAVLERISGLRADLAARESERRAIESNISAIHTEQERIRRNLGSVQSGSELYRRYVGILNDQENELIVLADRLETAVEAENAARAALAGYIGSL